MSKPAEATIRGREAVNVDGHTIESEGSSSIDGGGNGEDRGRLKSAESRHHDYHKQKGQNAPMHRSPMGDYLPPKGGPPLTSLAIPTPGPLDYEPRLPPSGLSYSILGKTNFTRLDMINFGPGTKYDVREAARLTGSDESPKWSIGIKIPDRAPAQQDTPSPLTYVTEYRLFASNDGPAYSISGRFPLPGNENPGPDRYGILENFGAQAPKYTLRPKLKDSVEETPGPQAYSAPNVKPSAPKAPSFTMRPRVGIPVFVDKEAETIPSANTYYPQVEKSQKAASLKGSDKITQTPETPGPANYIMPNQLFAGPQFSLAPRDIPIEEEDYFVPPPGPADYMPSTSATHNLPPKFSLGARRAIILASLRANVPGPNAYDPANCYIVNNNAPKWTLKGRQKAKLESTPGPADYNTTSPMFTLTSTQLARLAASNTQRSNADRPKPSEEKSPGPADYEVKKMNLTKPAPPAYSLGKRLSINKANYTPSPNAYNAAGKPNRGSQGISLKSRMSPFVLVFPSNRIDTLRVAT
ncbi:hypothetical protein HK102_003285 [Quaeritorhiza haematococci]|nr:hypothetical protein HK102_003285 [Quaeritorhiza haematococci]